MKKNSIFFDTENLAKSLINLIKIEKKIIYIFLTIAFFLSVLFSIFYEDKKYFSVKVEHQYISKLGLFNIEFISPNSFDFFIKTNSNENTPSYTVNHSFPNFSFKAKNKNEIDIFINDIDKLLDTYIEFVKKDFNDRLQYIYSEKNEDVEYLDLKYTLNSLIKEKIFHKKNIYIDSPDHISVTFLKVSIFIFALLFFLRIFYLISIKRIKIK